MIASLQICFRLASRRLTPVARKPSRWPDSSNRPAVAYAHDTVPHRSLSSYRAAAAAQGPATSRSTALQDLFAASLLHHPLLSIRSASLRRRLQLVDITPCRVLRRLGAPAPAGARTQTDHPPSHRAGPPRSEGAAGERVLCPAQAVCVRPEKGQGRCAREGRSHSGEANGSGREGRRTRTSSPCRPTPSCTSCIESVGIERCIRRIILQRHREPTQIVRDLKHRLSRRRKAG
jgi:hypothetical protein